MAPWRARIGITAALLIFIGMMLRNFNVFLTAETRRKESVMSGETCKAVKPQSPLDRALGDLDRIKGLSFDVKNEVSKSVSSVVGSEVEEVSEVETASSDPNCATDAMERAITLIRSNLVDIRTQIRRL